MEDAIYYIYTKGHTFIELVKNNKNPYYEYDMVFVDGKLGMFKIENIGFFVEEPSKDSVLKKFDQYLFMNTKGSRKILEWLFSPDRLYN